MRYRPLSPTGDYTIGKPFLIDSPDAVRQAIQTRLGLWTGQWFLDLEEGTPYSTDILGSDTESTRDLAIRTRILQTQGVDSIDEYNSSYDPTTRSFTVQAVVNTVFGPTTILVET